MPEVLVMVAAASALGVLAAVGLARARARAMLGLDHVHAFVDRVASLRAAALDLFDQPLRPGDPRTTVTAGGLEATYVIAAEGDRYRHHLAVRQRRGRPERAVAGRFLMLAVRRLRVEGMEVGLGVSPAGVHHARWVLDAEAQALFVDRAPPPLDGSALATVFAACLDEAERAPFEAMEGEIEPPGDVADCGSA